VAILTRDSELKLIDYQPHIDGLRALAVVLVMLHHLGDWAGLTGGYIGVDVFFVISGFLITSIVKAELNAGTFTFGGFYRRRVIRLAPAYITFLLVTSVAALVWLLPAELLNYARSVVASSFFVANVYMWREVGGYFGVMAEATPLLHLWSLAIEEQFYLLWPLALLLGFKYLQVRWFTGAVVLVALSGVVVSQWGVQRYPAAAYYLLPTRFFELAFGAALAFLPVSNLSKPAKVFLSGLGLALVFFAAFRFTKETRFPGYLGLIPVIGTAFLLRYGNVGWLNSGLSAPASTFLGKISYPAYLWHWPIISFLHINQVSITGFVGALTLISVLVLSWCTYRFVELPSRRFLIKPPIRVFCFGAVVPIAAFTALAGLIVAAQGVPSRYSESLNLKSEALLASSNIARGRCNEGNPSAPLPPDQCILGRAEGPVDFLIVGDSHANHFTGFFDELGKSANLRGYDMTRSQTVFLPGVEFWTTREGKPDYHQNFVPRNRYLSNLLTQEKYQFVVLAGNWSGYFGAGKLIKYGDLGGEKAFKQGMQSAVRQAYTASKTVIVVKSIPALTAGLYDCTLQNERFGLSQDCTMPLDQHIEKVRAVNKFFDELALEFPELVWIDPAAVSCKGDRCLSEIDGVPLYRDGGHLNDMGSRVLAREWTAEFGNPLERKVY
jgi:peptidoglycan/LPS O-acetylase OafA/YrhL